MRSGMTVVRSERLSSAPMAAWSSAYVVSATLIGLDPLQARPIHVDRIGVGLLVRGRGGPGLGHAWTPMAAPGMARAHMARRRPPDRPVVRLLGLVVVYRQPALQITRRGDRADPA